MSSTVKPVAKQPPRKWLVRCPGCEKDITKTDALKGDAVYVLGRIWHLQHLTCKICKTSLSETGCHASPLDASTPICTDCYMEGQHPCCFSCHLPLRETCLIAGRKKYHHECFRCYRCRGAMPNGEYFLWNGNPFDEDCFYLLRCIRKSGSTF
ncbi:unnamed protein product [Cylicocyclus nassatus]|uniref:LIM zinc-binding domain-containing protein n=1 Tax=Cylicocyclus nassatus TaxID=53992 RepID=A0AA36GVB1_CYLNA|nr:unnamed protein product [Cylicocyclus nassatus]